MAGRERKTYLELARIINPEQETNHKNWECTPSMTTDEHLTVQAIDLRNRLLTLPSLRSNKRLPNTIISLISGTASRNHKFRSPRTVNNLLHHKIQPPHEFLTSRSDRSTQLKISESLATTTWPQTPSQEPISCHHKSSNLLNFSTIPLE